MSTQVLTLTMTPVFQINLFDFIILYLQEEEQSSQRFYKGEIFPIRDRLSL